MFRPKIVYKFRTDVYEVSKEPEDDKIINACRILIVNWEDKDSALSGEAKRHQVYAKLIKIFPHAKKSRLALLIEMVISGCA